jgi:hypothetical protein
VPEGAIRVLELSPRVAPADVTKSKAIWDTWNSCAATSAFSPAS